MSGIVNDPSKLTISALKRELAKHNVPVPSRNSRKDEYVKLYIKHVSSKKPNPRRSEFSDDDEEISSGFQGRVVRSQVTTISQSRTPVRKGAYKIIFQDKLSDVEDLTDVQLRQELKKRGIDVGPITATTRQLYEKKLANIFVDEETQPALPVRTTQFARDKITQAEAEDTEEEEEEEDEEEETEEDDEEPEEKFSDTEEEEEEQISAGGDFRSQTTVTTRRHPGGFSRTTTTRTYTKRSSSKQSSGSPGLVNMPRWYLWLLVVVILCCFAYLVLQNMEGVPSLPKLDEEAVGEGIVHSSP